MSTPTPLLTTADLLAHISSILAAPTDFENWKPIVPITGMNFGRIELRENFDCVLKFSDCTFTGFQIYDGQHFKTALSDCTVEKNFTVTGGGFVQGLFLNGNNFGGLYFNKLDDNKMSPSYVSISHNTIKQYVLFSNTDFTGLSLYENTTKAVTLENSMYFPDTKQWVMGEIKNLNISLKEETALKVKNFKIKNFGLRGIVSNVDLHVINVQIEKLSFRDVRKLSSGTITFSELAPLNPESSILLSNSLMGSTVFHNCDFASFSDFAIYNSQLTEIIYTNTTWPKKISYKNDKIGRKIDKTELLVQSREIYRQLKMMASKQSDKLMENFFYSKEMAFLFKSINKKSSLETKISLLLNYLSNDFKQSWLRPTLWIFSLNLIFTLLLCSSRFCDLDFESRVFFNLLNPAHRFADMELTSSFSTLSIDFFSRIVNGFLFYQTVAAFRKLS